MSRIQRAVAGGGHSGAIYWTPIALSEPSDALGLAGSLSKQYGSRIDGLSAHRMSGGRRRLDLDWKPWHRRPEHLEVTAAWSSAQQRQVLHAMIRQSQRDAVLQLVDR